MDENNRNFILAIVLSMAVLFVWQFYFVPETPPGEQQAQQQAEQGPPTPSAYGEAQSGCSPQCSS